LIDGLAGLGDKAIEADLILESTSCTTSLARAFAHGAGARDPALAGPLVPGDDRAPRHRARSHAHRSDRTRSCR
jgi:hypothetical protein